MKLHRLSMILAVVALAEPTATSTLHAASPDAGAVSTSAGVTIEQPRAFGYEIGDILTQRIPLQLDGKPFEPAAMPRTERLGVWLERRTPRVESRPDGSLSLAVDYQIITSPQTLTLVTIPAWELPAKSGTRSLPIGEWSISVSPLTPRQTFATGGLEGLRPDRPAPIVATPPIRRQIAVWSSASLLTLAAWLSWILWRNWRASSAQPFARALREMRRIDDTSPQAWRALHRAFDRTAGQVIQKATLATLFQSAPQLAPLRQPIEQFFEQSSELFFGQGLPAESLSVHELCAELRRIEKRHEQ